MTRKPRILIENACYHVMSRGNQKQVVFFKQRDFSKYLQLLKKYKLRYKIKVYAYCLMKNHIHLILDPKNPKDMSKFIKGLNMSYAIWFNKEYSKVGHLWQSRFKSMVIQRDRYLLNCMQYVEFNPVRSNIASNIFEYPWSSYALRVLNKNNGILDSLKI